MSLHESVGHELHEAFRVALRSYSAYLRARSVFHSLGGVRCALRRVVSGGGRRLDRAGVFQTNIKRI